MVEFNFYLTDETFEKLADLKEQETDPAYKTMSMNDYAAEMLDIVIWSRHRAIAAEELPFK